MHMVAEQTRQSIYERIESAIAETGRLPDDFRFREEEPEDESPGFMPGALEGIMERCWPLEADSRQDDKGIPAFLRDHLADDYESTVRLYEKRWGSLKTASIRECVPLAILEEKEAYDAGRLSGLAYTFLTKAVRVEAVKLGLALMTLFETAEDAAIKNVFSTLGCYEDFTDYVLRSAAGWPADEQNRLCFALAKKMRGWGKIFTVEKLSPDTEEIREWILCEGCRNSVSYSYLGLTCAVKCNYKDRLRLGGLTKAERSGADDIMEGLLDEGPCTGISELPDREEILYWYLCANEDRTVDVSYLWQLLRIRDFLSKKQPDRSASQPDTMAKPHQPEGKTTSCQKQGVWRQSALTKLDGLLSAQNTRAILLDGLPVRPHDTIRAAEALRIDISDELLTQMRRDFKTFYMYGDYFLRPAEPTPRTRDLAALYIDLCEAHLDTGCFAAHRGDSDISWSPDLVVQYLDLYPGLGKELIRVSLRSDSLRWRSMAVRALLGWKKAFGTDLREFAPDLLDDVRSAAGRTKDSRVAKRFAELLRETAPKGAAPEEEQKSGRPE